MTRRSRSEGGVWQRPDGLWKVTVELPRVDGRRRQKVGYAKTKTEALRLVHELRVAAAIAEPSAEKISVAAYLERWLEAAEVRPKTMRSYKRIVENHLVPAIGAIYLHELNMSAIERFALAQRRVAVGDRTRQLTHVVL